MQTRKRMPVGAAALLAVLAAACDTGTRPPPGPGGGGGPVGNSPTGGGALGDGGADAALDAGASALPVIDGVLDAAEWPPVLATSNIAPAAIFDGSQISALYAFTTADDLYVAVSGSLSPGHALVAYVDADFSSDAGLTNTFELDDTSEPLNTAMSVGFSTPPGFQDRCWLGHAVHAGGCGEPAAECRVAPIGRQPTEFRRPRWRVGSHGMYRQRLRDARAFGSHRCDGRPVRRDICPFGQCYGHADVESDVAPG